MSDFRLTFKIGVIVNDWKYFGCLKKWDGDK